MQCARCLSWVTSCLRSVWSAAWWCLIGFASSTSLCYISLFSGCQPSWPTNYFASHNWHQEAKFHSRFPRALGSSKMTETHSYSGIEESSLCDSFEMPQYQNCHRQGFQKRFTLCHHFNARVRNELLAEICSKHTVSSTYRQKQLKTWRPKRRIKDEPKKNVVTTWWWGGRES